MSYWFNVFRKGDVVRLSPKCWGNDLDGLLKRIVFIWERSYDTDNNYTYLIVDDDGREILRITEGE